MIPRVNKAVRWDLRNCYPGCFYCNHDDPSHVERLEETCDKFYGKGTAEKLRRLSEAQCKWPNFMRAQLYRVLCEALAEAEKPGADKVAITLRVIAQTKRIL